MGDEVVLAGTVCKSVINIININILGLNFTVIVSRGPCRSVGEMLVEMMFYVMADFIKGELILYLKLILKCSAWLKQKNFTILRTGNTDWVTRYYIFKTKTTMVMSLVSWLKN